jgi:polysaccharide chain length determinant protein (PEP-CTERM system associated)
MTQQKELNPTAQAMELWEVVLHRKWLVLIVGVLFCSVGVVFISLMPTFYSSSITVLVDPQKIPERYVSDSVTMDQLRFDTLSQQILSTTRLQQVIDELQLYPELQPSMTHDEIIEYMRKNITIQERQGGDRNMSAFTIAFKGTNPKLVAQVATRLAESFIKWDLGARERQAEETSRFLENQLAQAKKELDEQEAKLSAFKMQHLGELPDQLGAYGGVLARLQSKLQANADALNRLDAEKILLLHADNSESSATGTGGTSYRRHLMQDQKRLEERLAGLRTRYSDEYPEVMQAQLEMENVRKQLQSAPQESPETAVISTPSNARLEILTREIGIRQQEQKSLLAEIRQGEAQADGAPVREQQLADLSRESQSARAHYQSLLDKTFSADIATDLERKHATERFMILDPARVPEKPIKRHPWRMLVLLIPCSFMVSAGSAVMIEKAKGTISTERRLRRLLPHSVAVVGRIPLIETLTFARRQLHLQIAAIAGALMCCLVVAAYLWRVHSHI